MRSRPRSKSDPTEPPLLKPVKPILKPITVPRSRPRSRSDPTDNRDATLKLERLRLRALRAVLAKDVRKSLRQNSAQFEAAFLRTLCVNIERAFPQHAHSPRGPHRFRSGSGHSMSFVMDHIAICLSKTRAYQQLVEPRTPPAPPTAACFKGFEVPVKQGGVPVPTPLPVLCSASPSPSLTPDTTHVCLSSNNHTNSTGSISAW